MLPGGQVVDIDKMIARECRRHYYLLALLGGKFSGDV
jgi:hypothetical protein